MCWESLWLSVAINTSNAFASAKNERAIKTIVESVGTLTGTGN